MGSLASLEHKSEDAVYFRRQRACGAVQGTTSFGKVKYGGPCPPSGSQPHRYMFKLYALDAELNLPEGATKAEIEKAMAGHVLEETTLIGLYGRK